MSSHDQQHSVLFGVGTVTYERDRVLRIELDHNFTTLSDTQLFEPWTCAHLHIWIEMMAEEQDIWSCRMLSDDRSIRLHKGILRAEALRRHREFMNRMALGAVLSNETLEQETSMQMRDIEIYRRCVFSFRTREIMKSWGLHHIRQLLLPRTIELLLSLNELVNAKFIIIDADLLLGNYRRCVDNHSFDRLGPPGTVGDHFRCLQAI